MGTHWTMLIELKEVREAEPIKDQSGYITKVKALGGGESVAMLEGSVLDRLRLVVSADTEAEAYARIIALLETNRPKPAGPGHGSCHGPTGEIICGDPAAHGVGGPAMPGKASLVKGERPL